MKMRKNSLRIMVLIVALALLMPYGMAGAGSESHTFIRYHDPSRHGFAFLIIDANGRYRPNVQYEKNVEDANGNSYHAFCTVPTIAVPGVNDPKTYEQGSIDPAIIAKMQAIYLHSPEVLSASEIAALSNTAYYPSVVMDSSIYSTALPDPLPASIPVTEDIFLRLALAAAQRSIWVANQPTYAGTPLDYTVQSAHFSPESPPILRYDWHENGEYYLFPLSYYADESHTDMGFYDADILELFDRLCVFYDSLSPCVTLTEQDIELVFDSAVSNSVTGGYDVPLRYKLAGNAYFSSGSVDLNIKVNGITVAVAAPTAEGGWLKVIVPVADETAKIDVTATLDGGSAEGIYLVNRQPGGAEYQPLFYSKISPLQKTVSIGAVPVPQNDPPPATTDNITTSTNHAIPKTSDTNSAQWLSICLAAFAIGLAGCLFPKKHKYY